LSSLMREGS